MTKDREDIEVPDQLTQLSVVQSNWLNQIIRAQYVILRPPSSEGLAFGFEIMDQLNQAFIIGIMGICQSKIGHQVPHVEIYVCKKLLSLVINDELFEDIKASGYSIGR